MQTACWQLWFPIVLRELGTRHASPPRFNPVESVAPPISKKHQWVKSYKYFTTNALSALRRRRRHHSPLRRLLEPIRQLQQPPFATRHPGKRHPKRLRLGIEARWERRGRRIRHHRERHDHRWIPRLGRDRRPARAREQQRVQMLRLHHGVDPLRPR